MQKFTNFEFFTAKNIQFWHKIEIDHFSSFSRICNFWTKNGPLTHCGTFKKWFFTQCEQNKIIQLEFSYWFFCWWENEGMTKWSLRWWSGRLSGWEFFKVEIMSCLLDFGLGQKFWIPLFHVKSIHLGSSSSWRVKKQSEPCLLLTFTSTSRPKTCQTQNFVASPFKDIFFLFD